MRENAFNAEADASSVFTEPFFLTIAETTTDCLRILNLRGEVEFMNARGQALLQISDWSRNRGRYWPDLWPEVSSQAVEEAVRAGLDGKVARFRAYCPTAAGQPKWWDNVVSPVRDHDRNLIGLLAVSRDVTSELDTEAFLDAVIENVPMLVFVKDAAEGRFQLINREAEAVFGHPRQHMLGKTDVDFFPPEEAAFYRSQDREVIASGRMVRVREEPLTRPDGEVRWFRTKKVATYGPEGPRHLVCVAEDITEERATAEALKAAVARAEAANQAKSEFLANMSHEIRTPLNGVVGLADVLAGTELDARQREMVELIRASGQMLERLLSDVLDLARIESGRIELLSQPFHLGAAVREVAGLVERSAQAKQIRFAVEIAPSADSWRLGDPVRFKQVLTNLLNNAVKFTERGGVRLTVEVEGEAFRAVVEDTGVGFDPAMKAQIFNRFQQADGSITRRFGGTGLGLAISRQLVELMGGVLDCDSEPGVGSRFFVSLALPPAQAQPGPGPELDRDVHAGAAAIRVLLADDHPTNRKVVELILAQAGIGLLAVEDGAQAIEAFRGGGFHAVLMDMQMPVMDGLTATQLIREHERQAGLARTPVIMLTANVLPEHVQAAREAGADRHLSKPVTAVGLLNTLVELIEAGEDDAADYAAAG